MRSVELLFLASLALGGIRGIISPNGVFALQMMALTLLVAIKATFSDLARFRSPMPLLLIVAFIVYFYARTLFSLASSGITLQNVLDSIKPLVVVSCLSLVFFRFQVIEDLKNGVGTRLNINQVIVAASVVSTAYILLLHIAASRIGRLEDGIYFSTLYMFGLFILISMFLSGQRIFSTWVDVFCLIALSARLLVDLRRTPILVLGAFIVIFLIVRALRLLFLRGSRQRTSLHKKIFRMVISLALFAGIIAFVQSGSFSRLNVNSLQYALVDVRIVDILIAVELALDRNPVFGLGPLHSYSLVTSNQVHSLPAALFSEYGFLGLGTFLAMWMYLVQMTIVALAQRHGSIDGKWVFLLSCTVYALFFTFSARGFEIEVFSLFGLGLAMGAVKR